MQCWAFTGLEKSTLKVSFHTDWLIRKTLHLEFSKPKLLIDASVCKHVFLRAPGACRATVREKARAALRVRRSGAAPAVPPTIAFRSTRRTRLQPGRLQWSRPSPQILERVTESAMPGGGGGILCTERKPEGQSTPYS